MDHLTPPLARPHGRYNVFQLLRLLQRGPHAVTPRFRADLSAGFPGREFSSLRIAGDTAHISTPNYCIAGTLGPLPETYTEWLRERRQQKLHGPGDFLDIYNHRVNRLRFDLKAGMLPELNPARPERSDHAQRLAALMGLGSPLLVRQIKLPPRAWLALAAMLGDGRRGGAVIERALTLVFDSPVTLRQWVGGWRPIEDEDRATLGGANARLGRRSVLGRQVWDQQARVRVTLSAWHYAQACAHLPAARGETPSRAFRQLRDLLRLLLDREFDCEVCLRLHGRDVPASRLGARPDRQSYWGLRLGQTAWLRRADHSGGGAQLRFVIPAFDQGAAA